MKQTSPWLVSTLANVLIGIIGVATSVLLSRNLGPVGRGILTESMLWSGLVVIAGGLVNTQSVVYFWTRAKETGTTPNNLGVSITLSSALVLILVPITMVIHFFVLGIHNKESYLIANIYTLSIPLALFSFCLLPVFLAEGNYKGFWTLRLVNSFLYLGGLLLLFATHSLTAFNAVVVILLASLVQVVATAVAYRRTFSFKFTYDGSLLKAFIKYGLRSNLSGLLSYLNVRLDQLLISLMLASQILGYYATAFAWASMLSLLGSGISSVILSRSASIDSSNKESLSKLLTQLRIIALVFLVIGILAAGATPIGILLLYGKEFTPSIMPAIILCFSGTLLNINLVIHEMLRGLGLPEIGIRAEVAGLGTNVILLMLLLPAWEGLGAAIASLLSYSVVLVLLLGLVQRKIGISPRDCLVPTKIDLLELKRRILRRADSRGR